MIKRGSVQLPQGGGGMSVDNGVVYVGAQPSYLLGGFVTVDVSNPNNPSIISGSDLVDPFIAPGLAVVPNGSGLGLAVGHVGRTGNQPVVGIADLSDSAVTDNFLTQFNLPASPFSVAIASGIGYVADGTGGLVVVNYVSFDNKGISPTVTATGPTGTTLQEGGIVSIRTLVRDDVQVRNVELLMNGVVVANDVSAPWDLQVVAPALLSGVSTVKFQVRATDTGGNVGLSNEITYTLTPDVTAPLLTSSTPSDGSAGFRVQAISLRFNEPIDAARLSVAGLTLTNLGANAIVGGGDDTTVAVDRVEQLSPQRVVVYTKQPLPEGRYRLLASRDIVADVAGNSPDTDLSFTFTSFDLDEQNAVAWVGGSDGDWNNSGNWSTGKVPGPNDAVIIDNKAANIRVRLPSGNVTVRSLVSREEFVMNGGSLTVTQSSEIQGRFEIGNGSTLTVDGVRALFIASGETKIDGGSFEARNGGTIQLPQATSYTHTAGDIRDDVVIRATGPGSVIDLRNVASLANGTTNDRITIEALSGGVVDLRAVQGIVDGANTDFFGTPDSIYIRANGTGSLVNMSALTSFSNASGHLGELSSNTGGELRVPLLSSLDGVLLKLDGTGTLPISQITTFTDGQIELLGGTHNFTGLSNAPGTKVLASGSGTVANLNQLVSIQNGGLELSGGATFNVPLLSNISGANLVVTGGVTLAIPNATIYTHTAGGIRDDVVIRATGAGSVIDLRNVANLANGTTNDRITIEALSGGVVDLRAVQGIIDGAHTDIFQNADSIYIRANGAGSLVNLSALTSFANASSFLAELSSNTGGELRVPLLSSLDGVLLKLDGTGTLPISQITTFTDGQIELLGGTHTFTGLSNAPGTKILSSGSGTVANLNQLVSIQNGGLELSGGATFNVPLLSNISGANLVVTGGVTLAIPNATIYTHTAGDIRDDVVIRATGAGSVIDLRNVASLANGTTNDRITIEALSGGVVDLRAVQGIVDGANTDFFGTPDSIYIRANGTGSLVNMSALASFSNASGHLGELSSQTGGELRVPVLSNLDGVLLKLDGIGTLPISQITTFTDGQIELSGGTHTFTGLSNAPGTKILSSGSGTVANLNQLVSIQNGGLELSGGATFNVPLLSNISGANLVVTGGVTLAIPNATIYTHTAGDIRDDVVIRATGAGSVIDLRNVANLANGTTNDRITIEALSGGVVDLRAVQGIVDGANTDFFGTPDSIYIRANGTGSLVNMSALTSFSNASGHLGELSAINNGILRIGTTLATLVGVSASVLSGGSIDGSIEVGTESILTGHDATIAGNVINRNIVRPGSSIGSLTITGNYTQTVAGTLQIEIGGAGAGLGYDQLRVIGTASLDGTLALQAINGFNPALNSTYSVVTYGSHLGEFAVVTGTTPASGKVWQTDYQAGQLSIVTAAPLRLATTAILPQRTEVAELRTEDVQPLLEEARRRWVNAGYKGTALDNVQVKIADLPGKTLGFGGAGIIWLDSTAAGAGWFIDTTPENDDEFVAGGQPAPKALMGVDLLTVLSHEMGHLIGLSDESSHDQSASVMDEELSVGIRINPSLEAIDDLFAESDWF